MQLHRRKACICSQFEHRAIKTGLCLGCSFRFTPPPPTTPHQLSNSSHTCRIKKKERKWGEERERRPRADHKCWGNMKSGNTKLPSWIVLDGQRENGTKVTPFLSLVYSIPATVTVHGAEKIAKRRRWEGMSHWLHSIRRTNYTPVSSHLQLFQIVYCQQPQAKLSRLQSCRFSRRVKTESQS